jgi:aminopeptidase N
MIDDFRTHADFLYLWDGVEAQALASQWFGNLITPRDWGHIWLNGSFAHYLDSLYTDHKNGHDEFLTWYLTFDVAATLGDWSSGYRRPIVTRYFDNLDTFTADNYTTRRGALVLRMLRQQLGEENWQKAFRHYVKTNANKQVSTENFRVAIEESTGQSMDWFFDQWLYKMGHPVFVVTKNYDAAKKELTLNVKQTQKIDLNEPFPQTEFFQGKIAVEIDGRIAQVWLEPKAENVFSFVSAQEPKLVHFDYDSVWIKEIKFEKSLDELLYQLENDKDILGKWQAIDELVKVAFNEKTAAHEKAKIYAGFRKTVLGKDYWRLRNKAIGHLRTLLAPPLDEATIAMLLNVVKNDKAWVRAAAITSLGMTKDPKFADLYLNFFNDESDRVINAAATALGKSKSPKAFAALVKLKDKPSWKNQSLISALNGLKELGDPRGAEVALQALADIKSPRWWLATPVWDYPLAAADTLVALGRADAAYPLVFARFKQALDENDYYDIFHQTLLIATLADPRGREAFDLLKAKFKDNANATQAVIRLETQFSDNLKKK